ncbi:hypothetical protein SDRG_00529 [Saprolegnia diclina VS20]|uniref:Uncharacterized protein n=1 Tax=Saprolegnia diclina (strain VS20) TaxID=1156394 RepID=T0QX39_SAPDV|nr:hypothetical protein SDRG_00529 [Saprolegnia diclina VS20]EQC42809.1 hypothetical protein SDRG_00529 [Saprolegnia diclina VS20]|eukprot:XP_008604232.1 hypothetical protein SDRG_00529 [Saprolegnia diclina VS20]
MVDTYGRSRPRQANIINARSRLHSPLFRHGRSATSSRADDDGNDDGSADDPLVRETPLYRHKQSFFGQDFDATVAASAPVRASPMAVASDSGRPPVRGGAARSSAGSTLDEGTHGECHSESALDTNWDAPLLTAENIGRAFSSVSRAGSASQLRAVSSEVSDSLSRMKMRKQEIEMASLVHKVQSQLRTMEDVIKELQNEHAIKNEMIKKQMNETNRILAERDQLQMELRSASQKSASPISNDMTHLRSSLQSFMQQTEQTQFLMMEQLKSIESSKGSPQRRHSVDAQKIEASVKSAMSEFASLQQNMMQALAPPTLPTPPVADKPVEKSVEKSVEKPRSLPPVKTASSAWKTAFFAMIGIWLVTLGVGAAQHLYGLDLVAFVAQETREMHVLVETLQDIETVPDATTPTSPTIDIVADVVTVQVNTDGAVDARVEDAFVNVTSADDDVDATEEDSGIADTATTSHVDNGVRDVTKDYESVGNSDADASAVDAKEDVVDVQEGPAKQVIVEEIQDVVIEEVTEAEDAKERVEEIKQEEVADDTVEEVKDEVVKVKDDVVDVPTTNDEAIGGDTKEADDVVSSDATDALDVVNVTATANPESNATALVVDAVPLSVAVVEVTTDVSSEIVLGVETASNASVAIVEAVDASNANEATSVDAADNADETDGPTPVDVEASVDIESNVDDDSAPEVGEASPLTKHDQAADETSEASSETPEASKQVPEAIVDESPDAFAQEPEATKDKAPEATKDPTPGASKEEPEATKDESSEPELVAANDAPEIAASQDAALVAIVTQFSAYTNVTSHALNTSAVPADVTTATDDASIQADSATTDADADVVDEPAVNADAEPVVISAVDVEEATKAPVSDSAPVEIELEASEDIAPFDMSAADVVGASASDKATSDNTISDDTLVEDAATTVATSDDAPTSSQDAGAESKVVTSELTSSSDKPTVLSAAAKALESLLADK